MRNPIGTHVNVGTGLHRGAFASAMRIGAETIQIFAGNPRAWAVSSGDRRQDAAFRDACGEAGMRVFVHTPYLVNLGSPTEATYTRSVEVVAHNLRRAVEIGAEGVVLHTGSCVTEGAYDVGLRQVRQGLLPLLTALEPDEAPWLLLEPTAGHGRSLCAGVDDLEAYLAALDHHPKAGICLDTCHVFASGAPLDEAGGATGVLDRLVELGTLRLVHANDSKDPRGSLRDRHERIGEGHIGPGAFEELFAHPATASVPFILETPGSRDEGDPGTALLRKIRDAATP